MPCFTVTVPPPRSVRMAALELLEVLMVRLVAFMVPPPVVIMPPEHPFEVVMVESEMFTVVPLP